jgi:hypothetical protein
VSLLTACLPACIIDVPGMEFLADDKIIDRFICRHATLSFLCRTEAPSSVHGLC